MHRHSDLLSMGFGHITQQTRNILQTVPRRIAYFVHCFDSAAAAAKAPARI